MSKSSLRWYYAGFICIIIAVLAFELIWLPAPLVMSSQLQWIEVVDWLYYGVLSIPLCWLIGAALSIKSVHIKSNKLTILPALLIIVGALGLILLLLQPLQYFIPVIVMLAASVLLIAVEIVRSRINFVKLGSILIGYTVVLLLLLCPTGYQVTYPAMTLNMSHYAQFAGSATDAAAQAALSNNTASSQSPLGKPAAAGDHIEKGWIDGVLVFERPAFPIDWLYAELLPQVELRKQEVDEPSITERYSQVVMMKNNANQLAAALAWEYSGRGKAIDFQGAAVAAIVEASPADGVLQAGDAITAINGQPISNMLTLQQYMSEHIKPGEQVDIQLQRENEAMTVHLTTIAAEQDANRAIMGIVITDKYDIELQQEIELNSYLLHAGGPSHGAMLTLALLNQLHDGDITGGLHVAGTGTIEVDGSVGMVGGIPQKAYAVSRTNAQVFFVPNAGVEAARLAAPELNIVGVGHFNDILQWIKQNRAQTQQTTQ